MNINALKQQSVANRLATLEKRTKGSVIEGDFEGSVTGKWVSLGDTGAGIVNYQSKNYSTSTIGFTSVPVGTPVELNFANGIYYSKF